MGTLFREVCQIRYTKTLLYNSFGILAI